MYGTIEDKKESDQSQVQQSEQQQQRPGKSQIATSGELNPSGGRIFSHCHVQSGENDTSFGGVDKCARRRLWTASIVCLIFMIIEIIGGILSGSLAIATDAAHLLTDFASFMISLFAIWLASKPASTHMSFGWYRAEVIGALMSVLMIWLITGLLVYIAIERLVTNQIDINPRIMLITAAAGLLVNVLMALTLHSHGHGHGHDHGSGHRHSHGSCGSDDVITLSHEIHPHTSIRMSSESINLLREDDCKKRKGGKKDENLATSTHKTPATPIAEHGVTKTDTCCDDNKQQRQQLEKQENINIRAALIHVIGDFVQSLGVLLAAVIIYFKPDYAIIDPICTFFFSIIVLATTLNVVRDAINVLMEGIPKGVNLHEVLAKLSHKEGILKVHNLRIWSLTMDKIAISTHIVIDMKQISQSDALDWAIDMLKKTYGFMEITIQVEEYREDMRDCTHCQDEDVKIPMESANN